jgi:hypothetical protein
MEQLPSPQTISLKGRSQIYNSIYPFFKISIMQVQHSLSNLQLELLKLFARNVAEQDLLEIKKLLVKYFAKKAMDLADKVWEENDWTEADEQRMLNEHLRTPYLSNENTIKS